MNTCKGRPLLFIERLRFSLPFCRSNETSKVQKPGKEDVMIQKVFVQAADEEETSLSLKLHAQGIKKLATDRQSSRWYWE